MKKSLDSFEEVWLHDFEFQQPRGENPDPLCMVVIELHSGRTIRLWRNGYVNPIKKVKSKITKKWRESGAKLG